MTHARDDQARDDTRLVVTHSLNIDVRGARQLIHTSALSVGYHHHRREQQRQGWQRQQGQAAQTQVYYIYHNDAWFYNSNSCRYNVRKRASF